VDDDCEGAGCVIGFGNQTLGEEINLTGTPYFLRYSSERQKGRSSNRSLKITLSGATIPASLKRIDLTVSVAGREFVQSFPAQANQTTTFLWDGMDAYGRVMQARQLATIDVGYTYDGSYQRTDRFGYNGNGTPIMGSLTRREVTLPRLYRVYVGNFDDRALALGGWTLSEHHFYDPIERVLYEGNGTRRSVQTVNGIISTTAGNGTVGFSGDGGPATQAAFGLFSPQGLAVAPDGGVYVADTGNRVIRRIAPNGIITTTAGTPGMQCGSATDPCGDGGQALQAQFVAPFGVAFGADGSYYVVDPGAHKIRKIAPSGIITTVAGNGQACLPSTDACGDEGPATQAKLNVPLGVTVTPDGAIYIGDANSRRVRRVGPDGIITSVAGSGNPNPGSCSNNGVPARQACLGAPFGVVMAPDGTLYFSDGSLHQLFRVGPDGIIRVIAGDGTCGSNGDGGPAATARLCSPEGIGRGPDNAIYIADWNNDRIRRVGPDGIINTVAGNGSSTFGGDGGAATAGQIRKPLGVAFGLDGSFHLADGNNQRVRRVSPPLPNFNATDIAIPSADGGELYHFNSEGRHLDTRNTLTGALKYTFGYDAGGRLISITDGDNNVTTITRNGAGQPTGVVSPFNQTTAFTLDANNYLASIANPAGNANQFTYNSGGLLTQKTDPRGNQNTFTYDVLGRLTRDDDAATGFQTLARNEQALGYTITHSTALNRTTTYQLQELANGDRQRTNTLPSGLQTNLLKRPNGTNTFNDPDGTVTNETQAGDPRWRMQAPLVINRTITTPGALNFNRSFSRAVTLSNPADPLTLVTQNDTTTINSRNYTNNYTAATRTFVFTTPAGRTTTTTTDTQSRTTAQTFANLNPANYTYDARGRRATATFGSGMEARGFTYSYHMMGMGNGALASLTNPLTQITSYSYDAAWRVNQITLPDTRVIGLGYDASGNLTAVTPPGRPAHTFAYNAVDRVATYTPPAVMGTGPTQFAYNLDRQPTIITRPDALTINYAYDAAGRLSTLTTPSGAYTHTYNLTTGNLTGLTAPGSQTLAFTYDGSLLTNTTWSGTIAGSVSRTFNNFFLPASQSINGGNTVNFIYDNDNLLTGAGSLTITRHAQNGLITGSTLSNVTDTRGYNNFGELTSYSASFNATSLYSTTYTRDKLGRITQKVESIQGGTANTYDYTYDAAGRLTQVKLNTVTISTYVYDSNDNRTTFNGTTTGTYDAQDRMTAYGATTFTYTANGELLTRTVGGMTTNYTYDVLGNLRNVTLPDTTQIEYVYDGLNRRVGKKVGGVLTQGLLYQNQLKPVAELDGSNNLLSRFIYGSRANVPDYLIKNGVTYRIISDHLGSVRLVVDVATGAVAQRVDYDEFGVVTLDTAPGFQPFGFAGGLYDAQTGLTHFGARDYDAATGRWTTKDPILFAGRDTNLYAYAGTDPVNRIDPNGLASMASSAGGAAEGGGGSSSGSQGASGTKCKPPSNGSGGSNSPGGGSSGNSGGSSSSAGSTVFDADFESKDKRARDSGSYANLAVEMGAETLLSGMELSDFDYDTIQHLGGR
jgi:RHS repeat-associated protein